MAKIGDFEVLIGCDPEFWVKDNYTGKLVSAVGLVEGTKENPYPLKNGSVQVDGMALEIGITPAKTMAAFNKNLDSVLSEVQKMVGDRYSFVFQPVAEFGKDYIAAQPLEARRLGCEPDYNAYTGKANPRPDADMPFRTASGHIHVSWKKNDDNTWPEKLDPFEPTHFEGVCMLTKVMDAYLGIPSVAWDQDTKRRQLYGAAGAFRPKCYGNGWMGMEYRVLSNKWLNPAHPQTRDLVFGNTIDAFTALMKDYKLPDKEYHKKLAKDIVDGADKEDNQRIATMVMKYNGNEIKGAFVYREKREKAA